MTNVLSLDTCKRLAPLLENIEIKEYIRVLGNQDGKFNTPIEYKAPNLEEAIELLPADIEIDGKSYDLVIGKSTASYKYAKYKDHFDKEWGCMCYIQKGHYLIDECGTQFIGSGKSLLLAVEELILF